MVNYLDLTIVLIMLLGAFWGLLRGFTNNIRKSTILVLLIASLVCTPMANWLYTTGVGASLESSLTSSIGETGGEILSTKLFYLNGTYYLGGAPLDEALQSIEGSKVVKMIIMLTPMILKGKESLLVEGGKTFLEIVMPPLTKIILLIICFVVMFILLKIILIIINHFLKAVFDKFTLAKWLDRLLGSILMLIKSGIFVLIGMWIVSFVAGLDVEGMDQLVIQINNSTIGKWIIDTNVLNKLLASVFGG